jgi:5-methylcytosine-specific restriction protein A
LAGEQRILINAGELHREVGGYPGKGHRMKTCCLALIQEQRTGDQVIESPPKGSGASLSIRYRLPR